MAYYAASPPPDKAPSLAPTTTSDSEGTSKKKKTSFVKRALKELSGGGGNNAKQPKGAAIVRPYGRGGVGVKAKAPSSHNSPPSSVVPSSPSHVSTSARPDLLSSVYTDIDQDDNQSVISSIPAPRRTQQWIEQQSPQHMLAPPTVTSPPLARPIPTHYYPPESPAPSTFTRSSDDHLASRHYAQYPTHQHHVPQRRLHDVQESEDAMDPSGELADQFGRLAMSSNSRNGPAPTSPRDRNMTSPFRSATMPATGYQKTTVESIGHHEQHPTYYSNLPRDATREPFEARSTLSTHQKITAQTHELQAQIDQLREAEKRARERLDALRKEDSASNPASGPSNPHVAMLANRTPSREEQAREEKEKLRQRDAAREREERGALASTSPAPSLGTSTYQTATQYPQASLSHGYAPSYTQPPYSQPPYSPATPLGYQDPNQQQLLLQLGTLLLQQQQQLAALGVGRAGPAHPAAEAKQAVPPYLPGGLDLNALLALGAAQAAMAQTHGHQPVHSGYAPSGSVSNVPAVGSSTTNVPHFTTQDSVGSSEAMRVGQTNPTSLNTQPLQTHRKLSSGTPITNTYNRDQGNPPLPGTSGTIPSTTFPPSPYLGLNDGGIAPPTSSSLPLIPSAAMSSSDLTTQLSSSNSLSPPPPPYVGRST